MPTIDIITHLRDRALVQDITDPALVDLCRTKPIAVYAGFDPTADSLHVGHMVSIMILRHFQLAGHRPIAVVGGGTGMIGDPSGRSSERNLLTKEALAANVAGIRRNLEQFLDFEGPNAALLLNNADWLGAFSFLEFLRDVGKYFRLGDMLAKDSVRRRLESESGLSFTEFSYQLLQAYDFKYLFENHQCLLQVGGSDQWGNITAGTDLIRRTLGAQAFGMTTPLLTNSEGQKMGKTASGAVWLTPEKFSPYEFYQYWLRAEDASVRGFIQMLTLVPAPEIEALMTAHAADPGKRLAQRRLAEEITRLTHGEEATRKAADASAALFGGGLSAKSNDDLRAIFKDVPSITIPRAELEAGLPLLDLLTRAGLVESKKEGKRLLEQRGIYLNNKPDPWPAEVRTVTASDLASESMLVLRAGKKNYCLVEFV